MVGDGWCRGDWLMRVGDGWDCTKENVGFAEAFGGVAMGGEGALGCSTGCFGRGRAVSGLDWIELGWSGVAAEVANLDEGGRDGGMEKGGCGEDA